jgi:hypothetical protein
LLKHATQERSELAKQTMHKHVVPHLKTNIEKNILIKVSLFLMKLICEMMKKIISTFLLFTISIFILQSCDSDDDGNPALDLNNEISIDGTIYTMDGMAVLQSYGANNDGSYDRDIEIFSNNLFVEFDLNTDSETGISDGTYSYSEIRQAFTFYNVEIEIQENNSTTAFNIQQGTVIINNESSDVSITFNLVAQDGTEIIGQWSGVLE